MATRIEIEKRTYKNKDTYYIYKTTDTWKDGHRQHTHQRQRLHTVYDAESAHAIATIERQRLALTPPQGQQALFELDLPAWRAHLPIEQPITTPPAYHARILEDLLTHLYQACHLDKLSDTLLCHLITFTLLNPNSLAHIPTIIDRFHLTGLSTKSYQRTFARLAKEHETLREHIHHAMRTVAQSLGDDHKLIHYDVTTIRFSTESETHGRKLLDTGIW